MSKSSWFVYLIRTKQNALYTGITTNVPQRLVEHQQGKQGAKYLRSKGPLAVVYTVEIGSRSLASKVEYRIKKLAKARKEKIVREAPTAQALLVLLKIPSDTALS